MLAWETTQAALNEEQKAIVSCETKLDVLILPAFEAVNRLHDAIVKPRSPKS